MSSSNDTDEALDDFENFEDVEEPTGLSQKLYKALHWLFIKTLEAQIFAVLFGCIYAFRYWMWGVDRWREAVLVFIDTFLICFIACLVVAIPFVIVMIIEIRRTRVER